ncbi:OB-fold domain-containing protein [Neobacillus sp. 114]|uniref:Zn-ribbon domain-containing OB-fold protein n=1 Tax=Neobacillus sp. 114 TaxID=3048535 RepID=UPI0024C286AA|nr:OB-fold domain-containing protein [Neobacillus sp. 114]
MENDMLNVGSDEVTQYYWDHCKQEKLMIQNCNDCKRFQFPPNLSCRYCSSNCIEWKKSNGIGEIYSYSVVYRAPSVFFEKYVPYVVALIKLDEGVMIESWIIQDELSDESVISIGAKVKTSYQDFGTYKLPVFKLLN